jgi:hypothetical protein
MVRLNLFSIEELSQKLTFCFSAFEKAFGETRRIW